jgi:hypothetical protein
VPPLVLDTQLVINPGHYGFEYWDDTSNVPEIAKVTLVGPTTVQLVLTHAPTNHSGRVRYAFTGTPNNSAGPFTGPRGNLRDSDATKSRHGSPLFNWCVHFDVPVVPK